MAELEHFSQQDPQWKSKPLGFDDSSPIGNYGCLLTCMAMVATGYGFDVTPDSLNEKMKAVGGFQGAYVMPYLIAKALPGMIYRDYRECNGQPAPLSEMDAYLAQGKAVIVEVDFSPKEGLQNHWIVLDAKQGNDYLIADPWPYPPDSKEVTLTFRFGFAGPPEKSIQAVLWLDGPAGAVTPAPTPNLDTGVAASFKVYAMSDDLAIRSQTLIADSTLITRVAMNTELTVLETDAAAKPKIGQVNQWLPIKTPDGTVGYVAAWYVSLDKQGPPAVPPIQPPPADTTPAVIVETASEAVALRSAPRISEADLIKRMPLGTQLQIVEKSPKAKKKIGVLNQWLQVKDVTGQVGLVAAWHVMLSTGQVALGAKDQAPVTPASVPDLSAQPAAVLLRTAVDNLALRSEPIIKDETLIKRLSLGAELIVTESADTAVPKIGKTGEWIRARDVSGVEGYVAAWYVSERPAEPALAAGPADS